MRPALLELALYAFSSQPRVQIMIVKISGEDVQPNINHVNYLL
jgi:hypothetical protein